MGHAGCPRVGSFVPGWRWFVQVVGCLLHRTCERGQSCSTLSMDGVGMWSLYVRRHQPSAIVGEHGPSPRDNVVVAGVAGVPRPISGRFLEQVVWSKRPCDDPGFKRPFQQKLQTCSRNSHTFPVTALSSPFSSIRTSSLHHSAPSKHHQKDLNPSSFHHHSSQWPPLCAPPPLRWPRWPPRAPARPSSLSSSRSSLVPTRVRQCH